MNRSTIEISFESHIFLKLKLLLTPLLQNRLAQAEVFCGRATLRGPKSRLWLASRSLPTTGLGGLEGNLLPGRGSQEDALSRTRGGKDRNSGRTRPDSNLLFTTCDPFFLPSLSLPLWKGEPLPVAADHKDWTFESGAERGRWQAFIKW